MQKHYNAFQTGKSDRKCRFGFVEHTTSRRQNIFLHNEAFCLIVIVCK